MENEIEVISDSSNNEDYMEFDDEDQNEYNDEDQYENDEEIHAMMLNGGNNDNIMSEQEEQVSINSYLL